MDDKEYVERLEKIIDKQDDLLTHLDAKFQQQESLNETLTNQNNILREDIKKHKNLLMDMNKTVNQHKNVVKKLKKELEDQLKIQQDLHKDYGEVIKQLTDELEEAKGEDNKKAEEKTKRDSVELPSNESKTDYVSTAANMFNDIKDKSVEAVSDLSKAPQDSSNDELSKCPNCGADVMEGFMFCESCGTKLR